MVFAHGETVVSQALRQGHPLVVGREAPSDVVLEEQSLSRQHARFIWDERGLRLEDLGSTNGTFVNGRRVQRAEVAGTDEVMLGDVVATLLPHTERDTPALDGQYRDFLRRVQDEQVRSREFGRGFFLAAVRAPARTPNFAQALQGVLRSVDACMPYATDTMLVLLTEADETGLRSFHEAVLQSLTGAAVRVGAVRFPDAQGSQESLIGAALDALRTASTKKPMVQAQAARRPAGDLRIVKSPSMRRLYELVRRITRTRLPVLLLGETGCGKELVARAVHDFGPRASKPFKAVNCAAIAETLLESVLFGHEKGAFTGADRRQPGLFEQADGGTVFLDEVGELSPQAQAALLRVLETRRFTRVGSSKELEADVRVVAATHRDLEQYVAEGRFRADLLYRIDALTFEVPPLRERTEEVLPLAEAFLERARGEFDCTATEFDPTVCETLRAYSWPGNVRQLRNVVERAAAICLEAVIGLDDLPTAVVRGASTPVTPAASAPTAPAAEPAPPAPAPAADGEGDSLSEQVDSFERSLIRDALERCGGNQSQAARLLGTPRRTLARKIKAFGLD